MGSFRFSIGFNGLQWLGGFRQVENGFDGHLRVYDGFFVVFFLSAGFIESMRSFSGFFLLFFLGQGRRILRGFTGFYWVGRGVWQRADVQRIPSVISAAEDGKNIGFDRPECRRIGLILFYWIIELDYVRSHRSLPSGLSFFDFCCCCCCCCRCCRVCSHRRHFRVFLAGQNGFVWVRTGQNEFVMDLIGLQRL